MLAPSITYDKISFNLMTFYNEQATDPGKRPRLRIILFHPTVGGTT